MEPGARHGAAGRLRRILLRSWRMLGWAGACVAVVLLLVVVGLAVRVVSYRQTDDPVHLQSKRAYLERIARDYGAAPAGPNFVVILFDDLGYGDLGVYGSDAIRTPRIDRLAAEGALFRQAHAVSPYCSASRAGLLTGRYPVRSGMDHVLQAPGSFNDLLLKIGGRNRRLPAEEITIAEVLSAAGYSTAIVGKWHLGGRSPSLPNDLGFDSFFGLLYSNDQGRPELWRDREVVERDPIDQATLTRRYTEQAVAFIEAHSDRPFFLYLPHTFPHVPLHVSADRLGRSPGGLYGDVVEELDESVGAVIDALQRTGVAANTLVLVTSDNGAWFQGSSGGLRGRKFDVFEGGTRVPLLAWWPGRVPAGKVIDQPVVSIDVFPTLLQLANLPAPDDRVVDGQSLVALLEGDSAPHGPIFYHQIDVLRGVLLGHFKYHDRHGVFYGNPMDWAWGPMRREGPWLFDLSTDPAESYDVSAKYPETARQLRALLERRAETLAENPRGWR